MNAPSFHEVMNRFERGESMDEQAFDMRLFQVAERMKAKYDIRYNPENPVPSDEALADRCFAAARELYSEVGTYCLDTRTVARFTLDEMDAAFAEAPAASVWGDGDDKFIIRHRSVGGDVPVFVWGGLQTLLFSDEETGLRVYRACCRCPAVGGVVGGITPTIEGDSKVKADSPEEVFPYRRSAELLRIAAAEAGRPGMPVINGAPKATAHIAMYAGSEALRPTDGIGTGGVPELKTTFDRLKRVSFALATGTRISAGLGAMIGGFSGSVEGAAIVGAAGAFQSRLMNRAEVVLITATPIQTQSRSTRNGIWVSALAMQALSRNTHLILAGAHGDHPSAGPGTEQYFYETAAGSIAGAVSGGHSWGATRKFKIGQTTDYGTPLESEFLGRICHASEGMDTGLANKVVVELLSRYEDNLADPPAGGTLHDLYDLDSERPLPAYEQVFNKVASQLRAMGVPFQDYSV
ncbi:MAG: monomethylamine:corrinoid methyltransferase [Armatimonadetes bacterium]|nr:monomethylamine:corrinoid methyltransferase [Armatimonadota bacterium]